VIACAALSKIAIRSLESRLISWETLASVLASIQFLKVLLVQLTTQLVWMATFPSSDGPCKQPGQTDV